MEIRFHKRVQHDLNEILAHYDGISSRLGDDFFAEFRARLTEVGKHPERFHFDATGLRRCNLKRFPCHFLFDVRDLLLRVWVVRHDRRQPGFGTRRFLR